MSNLTKAERDRLSESDFGDPKARLFPITDQDDVDSAAHLIGKAKDPAAVKARIVAIAKRKGLKLPDAWSGDASHSATFDLSGAEPAGDYVIRRGKIFEAGDYADKRFAVTPEEMLAAVADFLPVPNDLEHRETVLSGKLGELRNVAIGDNGWDLTGEVAIPKWLHDLSPDEPLKVSTTWDRATKRITGLALVVNPRVTDAAVMDAYGQFAKRYDTGSGQGALQVLHDMSSQYGAVCTKGNARMHSSHEASAIQAVHDLTTEHGAGCASSGGSSYYSRPVSAGEGGNVLMTAWEWLQTKLSKEPAPEGAPPAGTPAPQEPAKPSDGSATAAANAEVAELRAGLLAERRKRFEAEAARFAESVIGTHADPAERGRIVALHVQAAEDDAASAVTVVYGFDGSGKALSGSRVTALEASYTARPKSLMTRDMVPNAALPGTAVLSAQTGSEEEMKQVRAEASEWAKRNGKTNGAASGAEGK